MAINLSASSLQAPELEHLHLRAVAKWQVQPAQVMLEITETAVMDQTQQAINLLQTLDRLGFKLSMDDFSTGHSSLVNLRRLPVHELKVDRAFVMNMLDSEEDATIVRTVIELGHSLGKKIVAEGVENEAILQALAVTSHGVITSADPCLSRRLPTGCPAGILGCRACTRIESGRRLKYGLILPCFSCDRQALKAHRTIHAATQHLPPLHPAPGSCTSSTGPALNLR